MWYLNMTAVLGLAGMVVLLMLTRWWTGNKRWLLLAFNLGFLLWFSRRLFIFNMLYTAANYAGFRWLCHAQRLRRLWFGLFIGLNVAIVSLFRLWTMGVWAAPAFDSLPFGIGGLVQQAAVHFGFDSAAGSPLYEAIMTLGLIYNVLKVINAYYFAYYLGKDGCAPIIEYANYLLFIPTFTSGPILKFRDFLADARQPYRIDAKEFEACVKRIILGMFKKIVVASWMTTVFAKVVQHELHTPTAAFLIVWFYVLLFFDFSGYSDIAIGFGRLMGYRMPENFKRPFLSPSMTQFWRNWHVTLGDWFRDHIFMPFSRKATNRWTAAGLSLLIMFLMGVWHGFTWIYIVYGLYHGVVVALENIFGKTTVNRKKVSTTYFYFRVALTQVLVAVSVTVFSGGYETVAKIYHGLFSLPSF